MTDEISEILDTIVPEEKATPETKEETPKPEVDVKTVLAQKEHFRDKAEKLEKENAELRGKPAETNLTMEAIKVGKKLDKFSEEEIDSIAKIIRSDKPSDILAALENPLVMQGIQTAREKVTKENKVPSSSGSSGGDSFPSSDKIESMERDDHKKLWKEQQERQQGGQGV